MLHANVTPESEARWQAWLAKGQARERRRNQRIKVSLLALVSVAVIVASLALGLL